MISKNTKQILTVLSLMLITGFIIYYFYFKIENFNTSSTTPNPTNTNSTAPNPTNTNSTPMECPQITAQIVYKSVVSKAFGVGFNIEKLGNGYIINHIPINNKGVLGSVYAVDQDLLLTLKVRNNNDLTQRWNIENITGTDNYIIKPINVNNRVLQYYNGVLAVIPYDGKINYDSIKWLLSTDEIKRGIPVLNANPYSMFGTEFNPSGALSSSSGVSQESINQISDVLNVVKTGIQQYLNQASTTNQSSGGLLSTSSLGMKETPLTLNLNLSGIKTTTNESFDTLTNDTADVLSLLDRYDTSKNPTIDYLYSLSDLNSQLSAKGCKQINLNDYISNRVGSCNCKL